MSSQANWSVGTCARDNRAYVLVAVNGVSVLLSASTAEVMATALMCASRHLTDEPDESPNEDEA